MRKVLTPDICVIGAGSAGLTVAAAAAALGVSVVLIEKNRIGGARLNTACVPSRALMAAARHAQTIRDAADFGIVVDPPRTDFPAVMQHVRQIVAAVEPNDSAERFTGLGVTVLKGAARFIDRQTVTADETNVRARRFVIAAGSRPAVPPIPNVSAGPYLTSETILYLKRLPGRLVVIGGSSTGLAMAQAFRRLGSEVVVLEAGKVLADEDPELAALLVETLRLEGFDIREGTKVTRVARRGRSGVRLSTEHGGKAESLDATHLLIAAGRRPDLNDLGLAEGRIRFDERGIKVNGRLRTTNRRVYAIGDVTSHPRFAHWAGYQAELVVRSVLFRFGGKLNPDILPRVTFTEPELAHVGLSEAEAVRRYRRISVLRWPFSESDRAHTDRATRGLVKVLATRRGRIVGAGILGPDAAELIAPFALAVSERMKVKSLATAVFPYPTRSEAARRAAISFYAQKLDSRWTRRLFQVLRKFG
jgi:pyruvate/2-oxoglutarate dehydrogenase complex dihydrolipoamide dehydrogenase (E3) component